MPDAPVTWAAVDPAILDVDTLTGATFAPLPGAGRIQARVGNLRSEPVTVIAQGPLDTIYLLGNRVADTVTVTVPGMPRDTLSDSVRVQVADTAPGMPPAQTLIRRRVTYPLVEVFPPGGATITLVPNDTGFTNTSGIVAVRVRLDSGPTPDSVRVTVTAVQHDGLTVVPGSPLTFVVEFQ